MCLSAVVQSGVRVWGSVCYQPTQLNQRPGVALLVGCLSLLLASDRHLFTKGFVVVSEHCNTILLTRVICWHTWVVWMNPHPV